MKNHDKCRAKKEEKMLQNTEVLYKLKLYRLLYTIQFCSSYNYLSEEIPSYYLQFNNCNFYKLYHMTNLNH